MVERDRIAEFKEVAELMPDGSVVRFGLAGGYGCSTGALTWISSLWIPGQRAAPAVAGKGRSGLDRLG